MESRKGLKDFRIYVYFAALAAIMIIIYPKEGKFRYEYQKGRPWVYATLISPIDFPILKTDAEILSEKEQKASEIIDYYNFDDNVGAEKVNEFTNNALNCRIDESITNTIVQQLVSFYEKGIVSEFGNENVSDKVIYVKRGKRIAQTPATEVYDVKNAFTAIVSELRYLLPSDNADSIAAKLAIEGCIVPNLFYDEAATNAYHKEAVNFISPTKGMIYAGQLIVSKGELVTAEIEQLLDSYKAEYKHSLGYSGSTASMAISHTIQVLILVMIFFLMILFIDRKVFEHSRQLICLLIIDLIAFAGTMVLYGIDQHLLFIFPFTALALYGTSFFKNNLIYPLYLVMLLPLILISEKGVELFIMNATAGGVALIAFSRFSRGWQQFLNAVFIITVMMLVYISNSILMENNNALFGRTDIIYISINAALSIVLYPLVYLFELAFSLISSSRLWELADTNNLLLQELSHKAPGTFQHTLQVANLSESAARKIGANSTLIRVGALYHDIGKSVNPICFVENQRQGVDNYHKNLSPEESAKDIIRHVEDGMVLAKKHRLPAIVSDFIRTHHGTSRTAYFYNMYCNAGGNPENTMPFTYTGQKPRTKEHAILMLADAVEAASRTLKVYDAETVSQLVERIAESKFSEGQFSDADISLGELTMVKDSLKEDILQVYHARIEYPKRNK